MREELQREKQFLVTMSEFMSVQGMFNVKTIKKIDSHDKILKRHESQLIAHRSRLGGHDRDIKGIYREIDGVRKIVIRQSGDVVRILKENLKRK